MWIETDEGDFVDISKAHYIFIWSITSDRFRVLADFPFHEAIECERRVCLCERKTKEEARACIRSLMAASTKIGECITPAGWTRL